MHSLVFPLLFVVLAAAENRPSLTLTMAKGAYVYGEPLEAVIRVNNPTDKTIRVWLDYPEFEFYEGLQFDAGSSGLVPWRCRRLLSMEDDRMWVGNYLMGGVDLPPREKWATNIYLQRYVQSPRPGTYRLPYKFHLRCCLHPDLTAEFDLSCNGELAFSVEEANREKLEAILERHAKGLGALDHWEERSAIEALEVTDDPMVVPYLIKIIQSAHYSHGFRAIRRFPKNADAQAAVIAALDLKPEPLHWTRQEEIAAALQILAEWKHPLPQSKVQALLQHENEYVREVTAAYIEAIEGKKLPWFRYLLLGSSLLLAVFALLLVINRAWVRRRRQPGLV